MKLRNKLVVLIVFLLVIVIVINGLFFYIMARKILVDRVYAQLESIGHMKEEQLSLFFEAEEIDLRLIADSLEENPMFVSSITHVHNGSVHEDSRSLFLKYLQTEEDFEELFFVNADGKIHLSTNDVQEGKFSTGEEYFLKGREGAFISGFYFDIAYGRPALIVSAPIDSDSSNLGVLAVRLNLEEISEIMEERSGMGETGETILVNNYGLLVSKSRFIHSIEFKKVLHTPAVNNCIAGKRGYANYQDYRGVPSFIYYAWNDDFKVCIISKIDEKEALGDLTDMVFYALLIFASLTFLSVLLALYFSKAMTMNIKELQEKSIQVSKGNLDIKFSAHQDDELGELASTFEHMAKELKKSKSELELQKVWLEKEVKKQTIDQHTKIEELEKTKLAIINILEDTNESNSELNITKDELKKKVKQLDDINKKKDEFISVTAHELKTPLTSIKGFTELLKNEQVMKNKEMRETYFNIIIQDTMRLGNLITDILDLTRFDLGTLKFNLEDVSADDIVSDVKNLVGLQVKNKGLGFPVEFEKGIRLNTDRSRIVQVVSNLVNNSIKYTEKGEIRLQIFRYKGKVHFRVTDTGVGIPKEAQSRIFERFYQADSSYTRTVGGSGLGLSICKTIVESLGGAIWFESRKGMTMFEFTLNEKVNKK